MQFKKSKFAEEYNIKVFCPFRKIKSYDIIFCLFENYILRSSDSAENIVEIWSKYAGIFVDKNGKML